MFLSNLSVPLYADTTLILRCHKRLVLIFRPFIVKLLNKFHVQIAGEIFAFSYCIVSSKRYEACVIKLTNWLCLVSDLSLQCSLMAHFYPHEEMGQTEKKKKERMFPYCRSLYCMTGRCCSVCNLINFSHLQLCQKTQT